MTWLLLLACASDPESDTAAGDTADLADTAASSGDTAVAELWDWGDGIPSCNWFYAAGPLDEHSLYVADFALPEADFYAGVDVAYDRSLAAGEVVLWFDDAATDSAELFVCSDITPTIVGRRVEVVAGRLTLSAVATGPDPECGSPQTYAVSWSLTDLETAEGPTADLGPHDGIAGFFGGCYG